MGATNHTSNYNLSQFIGTDKPTWLSDYNGDMLAIDTAIKNTADAAAAAQTDATNAGSAASGAASTANTLNTQINTPVTGIAAVVSGHTTQLTGLDNLIGNTPLTTVAQTVTGAIEEVKGSIPSISGTLKFIGTQTLTESYNGSKTVAQALNSIYSALVSIFANLQSGEYVRIICGTYKDNSMPLMPVGDQSLKNSAPASVVLSIAMVDASDAYINTLTIQSSSTFKGITNNFTITDASSLTPANGSAQLVIEKYKLES